MMATTVRVITSVSSEHQQRLALLAAAQGMSMSRLVAGLIERTLSENPHARVVGLLTQAQAERTPAAKYTVRLIGVDAACLEERAYGRSMTVSTYAAQVLRSHLRANPPMPYEEFQELRRVVNELTGVRCALQQLLAQRVPREMLEQSAWQSVMRLLPALKQIRNQVRDTLIANSKSWETPDVES